MAASEQAQALWYVGPGKAEIRAEPVAAPAAGEVRLRAVASALSRGTERLVFAGRVPESEYERMRAPFMSGAFPFPVKYGYAMVARIEEGPAELKGRLAFALYPHQTVFNLPAENIVPLPDGLPAERAVLGANMETALNAVWDGAPGRRPDRGGRRGRARAAGRAALRPDAGGGHGRRYRSGACRHRQDAGRRLSQPDKAPENCDLVVHTSASAAGLATALRLAGDEATVLELSWYGSDEVKGAARRRLPFAPPEADLQPGRQGRALAPAALGLSAPLDRRARTCSKTPRSTR